MSHKHIVLCSFVYKWIAMLSKLKRKLTRWMRELLHGHFWTEITKNWTKQKIYWRQWYVHSNHTHRAHRHRRVTHVLLMKSMWRCAARVIKSVRLCRRDWPIGVVFTDPLLGHAKQFDSILEWTHNESRIQLTGFIDMFLVLFLYREKITHKRRTTNTQIEW